MTVVDTTLLVDLEREWPPAQRMMNDLESFGRPILIPAIVWVEYLSGVPPSKRPGKERLIEGATSFIAFDRTIADEAVRMVHECAAAGKSMSWTDLQVAATTRALNDELVSNDGVFADVAGLSVQRY
jgi:predicted nucleic acid-binding protein